MWHDRRSRTAGTVSPRGRILRALAAIRESTGPIHDRVEHLLDLLSPGLDARRLAEVLNRFHAFWSAVEAHVDLWAHRSPVLAAELDWPRRRRTALLAADVLVLSPHADHVDGTPVALMPATDAGVLGWLYVSEGSTLGGAVLSRHLSPRGLHAASFTPYPEGPGPMWKRFGAVTEDWAAGGAGRIEAVTAAAQAAFTALADWLEPLDRTAAAPIGATA